MSRLEQIKARKIRAINELYERNELRGNASTVLEEDVDWLIARVETAERNCELLQDANDAEIERHFAESNVLNERIDALLAENVEVLRAVREMVVVLHGMGNHEDAQAFDDAICQKLALTAAEVERVRALERVVEAAKTYRKAVQKMYDETGVLTHSSQVHVSAIELDVALAALEASHAD